MKSSKANVIIIPIVGWTFTALEKQLFKIVFTLLSLIVLSCGFVHLTEGYPLYTALYMILTVTVQSDYSNYDI
jgi:hypothetical protein